LASAPAGVMLATADCTLSFIPVTMSRISLYIDQVGGRHLGTSPIGRGINRRSRNGACARASLGLACSRPAFHQQHFWESANLGYFLNETVVKSESG
jgi:hypothetical protein